jgi:hypothetical protein
LSRCGDDGRFTTSRSALRCSGVISNIRIGLPMASHYAMVIMYNQLRNTTLVEYILTAQHRPHVSHFVKQADHSWTYREYNNLDDVVTLTSLGCDLVLREIYSDVSFDAEVRPPIDRIE